ncbi:hypothetical protein OROGR_016824 [Orobanche gracilis]
MGRGRGKGKKQSVVAACDNDINGEDDKLPISTRGRPHKPLKDEIDEEVKFVNLQEEEDGDGLEETKSGALSRGAKSRATTENGSKRKRHLKVKQNAVDLVNMQNGIIVINKTNQNNELVELESVGYRAKWSRRKKKPTRAAEVRFECKLEDFVALSRN